MEKWAKGDMKRTREPSRWRQKGSSRARAQESEPSPPSPSPAQLQQTCLLLPVPRGTVPASLKVWDEGHLLNEGRDRERAPASAQVPTLVSSDSSKPKRSTRVAVVCLLPWSEVKMLPASLSATCGAARKVGRY